MPDELSAALRAILEEFLGRPSIDEGALERTAARLRALHERATAVAKELERDVEPAFSFMPQHPAFAVPMDGGAPAPNGSVAPSPSPTSMGSVTAGPAGPFMARSRRAQRLPAVAADDEGRWSLLQQIEALRSRRVSATELVRRRLEQAERLGPLLNAFITLLPERALREAEAVDRAIATGADTGPLCGVPLAVKDIFHVAGVPTTAGAAFLARVVADHDATAVVRLRRAGAIIIGKTNTHQFAFGATNESSHIGPARNPWHLDHTPGGSSGGSGAAVAAGIVAAALGSDTGGSVRIPAAACGIFGIKPTYGRVSKAGVLPLSWSLDHVGPLAASAADAALLLEVLAGPDAGDASTQPVPVDDYLHATRLGAEGDLRGLRVAIVGGWFRQRIAATVERSVERAAKTLAEAGAEILETDLPEAEGLLVANRLIILAEAAAYHAAFWPEHAGDYAADVRARVELGQVMLAGDYLLGQRLRAELTRRVSRRLGELGVDLLLTPTLPLTAPKLGQAEVEWPDGREAVADALIRFTAPFNVTGQPAASVPFGVDDNGLPIGVQLVGRPFAEATVLRAAACLEAAAQKPST
ncbi:MAG TPA: amidase [Bacillota bacterium]